MQLTGQAFLHIQLFQFQLQSNNNFLSKYVTKFDSINVDVSEIRPYDPYVVFSLVLHDCGIFSNPKSVSFKFFCAKITHILTYHSENLIFQFNNGISYFKIVIK